MVYALGKTRRHPRGRARFSESSSMEAPPRKALEALAELGRRIAGWRAHGLSERLVWARPHPTRAPFREKGLPEGFFSGSHTCVRAGAGIAVIGAYGSAGYPSRRRHGDYPVGRASRGCLETPRRAARGILRIDPGIGVRGGYLCPPAVRVVTRAPDRATHRRRGAGGCTRTPPAGASRRPSGVKRPSACLGGIPGRGHVPTGVRRRTRWARRAPRRSSRRSGVTPVGGRKVDTPRAAALGGIPPIDLAERRCRDTPSFARDATTRRRRPPGHARARAVSPRVRVRPRSEVDVERHALLPYPGLA